MIRKSAYFSGRVQGVNFRANTVDVARGFEVTGYVRNLPDGRVELVAEGEPGELDRFVQAVQQRMSGFIASTEVTDGEATGEFTGFTVER